MPASGPYDVVTNISLLPAILKRMMAFPTSLVPPQCPQYPWCGVTELQLLLGLEPTLKTSGCLSSSKVDQVFLGPLHVTTKSPQAQGSMLPSFLNFPFHWVCWYLTRSDSFKERKSEFELVGIQFEMKEWAGSLSNSLSTSMPSSLWTFCTEHVMIYDVDIIM